MGAVGSEATVIIYVKMIARPRTEDPELKKLWTLKGKFNQELEALVESDKDLHLMELTQVDEFFFCDG